MRGGGRGANPIRLSPRDRRIRSFSRTYRTTKRPFFWNPNCHRKFVEAVKESGGFENVTAFDVWEIMKTEFVGGVPTLKDASGVLGMLQLMFPEYMVSPPSSVTFFLDVKSEAGSCESMVSDLGKLKLAPKIESSSCDTMVSDFGQLKLLAPHAEPSSCDTVLNEFGKFNIQG